MTPLVKERLMFSSDRHERPQGPTIWVHRATFSYRLEKPEREWETLWVERPGWGLLRRRDLWIPLTVSESELQKQGFVRLKPASDSDVNVCRTCKTYMVAVPGILVQRHLSQCGSSTKERLKLDELMLDEQRLKIAEQKLRREQRERQLEKEAEQKKERFERIREEAAVKQGERDRKRRLKEEAKDQFMHS